MIADVLYSLHLLPVRRQIEFKTATLCFKAVKLSNPSYLKNMLKPYEPLRSLHSSTMDLLMVPPTDTSFGLRRFSVAGPRIWNGLPHELWQYSLWPNTSVFQVSLEDILLPQSHGQLAPHSQVAPPIVFLWRSLHELNNQDNCFNNSRSWQLQLYHGISTTSNNITSPK